ncbi:hypothetical protein GKR58_09115 [Yersinia pseudotuberculosis]|uniref:hypothetical protein n=1 Tax=Yersinia pseudotuberculosis TaxID=633 RepID=UPI001A9E4EF0|nr:hypothetical protein [Yersinia pseudotuberculosis]MBO1630401.1 hypothetical protein [Yersinia pseudotuberculosis]MBP0070095.1 hypothetical protein [Yersinia pseudotuberculosis]
MIDLTLDQYFTPLALAKQLTRTVIELLAPSTGQLFVEPSEGAGAFTQSLSNFGYNNIIGYDIDPKLQKTIKQDFLTTTFERGAIVIGNPPFGQGGRMAMKFIHHAASQQASAICFILPRGFTKKTFLNRIPTHYHLIYIQNIGEVFNDTETRSTFMIFEHRDSERYELPPTQLTYPRVISRDTNNNPTQFLQRTGSKIELHKDPLRKNSIPVIIHNDSIRQNHNVKKLDNYAIETSTIIKTIRISEINQLLSGNNMTPKILRRLSANDFNFAVCIASNEDRAEILKIDNNSLTTLINNIQLFHNELAQYKQQHAQQLKEEKEEKLLLLKSIIEKNGFSMKEIAQLLVDEPTTTKQTKAKATTTAKEFVVKWLETDKKTNETTTKSYKIVNFNVTNNKIANEPFFQAAMKKMDNNIFEFMATYSEEYRNFCNAENNNQLFYISNSRWNAEANRQFDKWVSEQQQPLPEDIKEQRQAFKSSVLIK